MHTQTPTDYHDNIDIHIANAKRRERLHRIIDTLWEKVQASSLLRGDVVERLFLMLPFLDDADIEHMIDLVDSEQNWIATQTEFDPLALIEAHLAPSDDEVSVLEERFDQIESAAQLEQEISA